MTNAHDIDAHPVQAALIWLDRRIDWQRFFQSAASVQTHENQRLARLVAILSIAILLPALIVLPIWIIGNSENPAAGGISGGILVMLIVAYSASRTRYYRLGAYILIGLLPGVLLAVVITAPGAMTDRMLALNFLVVAVLLASILLRPLETIFVAVGCLIVTSAFFLAPDVPFAVTYSYLVYNGLMSALLIVIAINRRTHLQWLHRSERRYRSLFEQSNDAVFILNLAGVHVEVNQRAADMLGYTLEEIAGLSIRDVVVPAEYHQSDRVMERMLAHEKVPPYERRFRKKDGTEILVEINVELVCDEAGNPRHVQSVVRDITQRKHEQAQALGLAVEQERVQILAQFVQSASHEFRTPLSVISTNLYALTKTTDAQMRQKAITRSQQSIDRLSHLVDMMLTMTRLDSDIPFACSPVDLNDFIRPIVRRYSLSQRAQTVPITVEFNSASELSPVCVDRQWFTEALNQLLDNALRFTYQPGTVMVNIYSQQDNAVIDICDQGVGIEPEALLHIFERFWRHDKAHSTPGFGLGLPIAREIIQRHGGVINVESSLGNGSVFRIILPVTNTLVTST